MNKGLATIILFLCFFSLIGCEDELSINENNQSVENYQPEGTNILVTTDVSDVGLFTAVLHGKTGMPPGEGEDYTLGFQLSTDSLFTEELTIICIVDSIASDSTFSFSIIRGIGYDMDMPSLDPGTQYFVRSFIVLGDNGYIGNVKSFKTDKVDIFTGEIDTISNTINCKVNLLKDDIWIGGFLGVCYGKNPYPTIDDNKLSNDSKDIVLQEDGTYSVTIDFPIIGSIFYYRAYYYYNGKTYYGETRSTFMSYDYVDMGLSVNWATCNVGASTALEYGDYYAWGETEPKTEYYWQNYKWCNGSSRALTKYCPNIRYGSNNYNDAKNTLDLEDDVAHVNWGGSWRMPTVAEMDELNKYCTWQWKTLNGVYGYMVTSNKTGYTDRSIFLPAAGCRNEYGLQGAGSYINYWSSSLDWNYEPYYASCMYFSNNKIGGYERFIGQSVRAVCPVNVESFTIECDELLIEGNSCLLNTVINGVERNVSYLGINWSSDNETVATVNSNGRVTGLSVGTATITATCMDKTASFTIKVVEESEITHEYVDLGLSVKWATFNVGAMRQEEFGRYYGWGETEVNTTPDDYKWGSWDTIQLEYRPGKYREMVVYGYTKYNDQDSLTVLDLEDDVAHVRWGGSWRMPTVAEMDELFDNCTWIWYAMDNKEFNGVPGYKLISNKDGYTENFIFLPAAGYRDGERYYESGNCGIYWSSSIYSEGERNQYSKAYSLHSYSYQRYMIDNDRRRGLPVRPVCP